MRILLAAILLAGLALTGADGPIAVNLAGLGLVALFVLLTTE